MDKSVLFDDFHPLDTSVLLSLLAGEKADDRGTVLGGAFVLWLPAEHGPWPTRLPFHGKVGLHLWQVVLLC